jgi:glyoxylase-like metal-dependent hydrolase (beta-lactamase superfamily II)
MSTVPTATIGRPGDPAAVRQFTFDDVVVTYVVDGVVSTRPQTFFPGTPLEAWKDRCNPAGDLLMSCGGLLVQAGVGAMTASFAFGRVDSGAMLDVLAALAVSPGDVDVLAFTHLHFDHAGWAFTRGARTFPNARYTLAAREWAAYAGGVDDEAVATSQPVIDEFRSDDHEFELFNDGDEIVPGVRALVTPGHTPGHTAYEITSQGGRRLIAFGDAFHSQSQVAHPDWMSMADSDEAGVIAARHRLLARLTELDAVAFGMHFGDQPFGRVAMDSIGHAGWQPIPSVVLDPLPRQPIRPAGTPVEGHHDQYYSGGSK